MKFSTALTLLSTATGVLATNRAVEIINGPIGGGNAEAENYNAMTTTAAEAMMGETTTAAAMMGETTPLMDELAMTTKAAKMGMSTEAAMMGMTTDTAMMGMATEAAMMGMATDAAMMETSTEAAMMGMTTEAAMMAGESTTMAAAAAAMTHTVMVGGTAGLVYTPNQVTAAVGDVVHFMMLAKNHTVTQSTFAAPCVKMAGGMDSGFLPNDGLAEAPTFQVTVSATTPTWWYCKQKVGTHCGNGMVFAINPTAEKSFEAFQSMAIAQNGTGAAATTAAAAASGTVTLSVDNGNGMTTMTTAAAVATTTSIAAGWNTAGNAQSCNCACFCGVAAFPAGAGVGAVGGFSGSMPAPWSG